MPRRRLEASQGFTLLEVLIAAVFLGGVFVAVMGLLSQSLRNVERMVPHEHAMLHAREKMTELLLWRELAPERMTGQWGDGFHWQVDISAYELGGVWQSTGYDLFKIRVQVSWKEREQFKIYGVETTQWARRVNHESTP